MTDIIVGFANEAQGSLVTSEAEGLASLDESLGRIDEHPWYSPSTSVATMPGGQLWR